MIKLDNFIVKIRKLLQVIIYFLFHHHQNVAELSSYGLTNIRPYRIKYWYRNIWVPQEVSIDNSIRRYYTGEFNGTKCFIKTMTAGITAQNEIFINKYFAKIGLSCVPDVLLTDENYMEDTYLLVTEFKPHMKHIFIPEDEKDFENICTQLENIHALFHEFNIMHLDLHGANVHLDKNNNVVIIDFGIAWIPGAQVYPPAFYFKGVPLKDIVMYDNAYYFIEILDNCGIPVHFKQKECYQRIESLIGVHTYAIQLDNREKSVHT